MYVVCQSMAVRGRLNNFISFFKDPARRVRQEGPELSVVSSETPSEDYSISSSERYNSSEESRTALIENNYFCSQPACAVVAAVAANIPTAALTRTAAAAASPYRPLLPLPPPEIRLHNLRANMVIQQLGLATLRAQKRHSRGHDEEDDEAVAYHLMQEKSHQELLAKLLNQLRALEDEIPLNRSRFQQQQLQRRKLFRELYRQQQLERQQRNAGRRSADLDTFFGLYRRSNSCRRVRSHTRGCCKDTLRRRCNSQINSRTVCSKAGRTSTTTTTTTADLFEACNVSSIESGYVESCEDAWTGSISSSEKDVEFSLTLPLTRTQKSSRVVLQRLDLHQAPELHSPCETFSRPQQQGEKQHQRENKFPQLKEQQNFQLKQQQQLERGQQQRERRQQQQERLLQQQQGPRQQQQERNAQEQGSREQQLIDRQQQHEDIEQHQEGREQQQVSTEQQQEGRLWQIERRQQELLQKRRDLRRQYHYQQREIRRQQQQQHQEKASSPQHPKGGWFPGHVPYIQFSNPKYFFRRPTLQQRYTASQRHRTGEPHPLLSDNWQRIRYISQQQKCNRQHQQQQQRRRQLHKKQPRRQRRQALEKEQHCQEELLEQQQQPPPFKEGSPQDKKTQPFQRQQQRQRRLSEQRRQRRQLLERKQQQQQQHEQTPVHRCEQCTCRRGHSIVKQQRRTNTSQQQEGQEQFLKKDVSEQLQQQDRHIEETPQQELQQQQQQLQLQQHSDPPAHQQPKKRLSWPVHRLFYYWSRRHSEPLFSRNNSRKSQQNAASEHQQRSWSLQLRSIIITKEGKTLSKKKQKRQEQQQEQHPPEKQEQQPSFQQQQQQQHQYHPSPDQQRKQQHPYYREQEQQQHPFKNEQQEQQEEEEQQQQHRAKKQQQQPQHFFNKQKQQHGRLEEEGEIKNRHRSWSLRRRRRDETRQQRHSRQQQQKHRDSQETRCTPLQKLGAAVGYRVESVDGEACQHSTAYVKQRQRQGFSATSRSPSGGSSGSQTSSSDSSRGSDSGICSKHSRSSGRSSSSDSTSSSISSSKNKNSHNHHSRRKRKRCIPSKRNSNSAIQTTTDNSPFASTDGEAFSQGETTGALTSPPPALLLPNQHSSFPSVQQLYERGKMASADMHGPGGGRRRAAAWQKLASRDENWTPSLSTAIAAARATRKSVLPIWLGGGGGNEYSPTGHTSSLPSTFNSLLWPLSQEVDTESSFSDSPESRAAQCHQPLRRRLAAAAAVTEQQEDVWQPTQFQGDLSKQQHWVEESSWEDYYYHRQQQQQHQHQRQQQQHNEQEEDERWQQRFVGQQERIPQQLHSEEQENSRKQQLWQQGLRLSGLEQQDIEHQQMIGEQEELSQQQQQQQQQGEEQQEIWQQEEEGQQEIEKQASGGQSPCIWKNHQQVIPEKKAPYHREEKKRRSYIADGLVSAGDGDTTARELLQQQEQQQQQLEGKQLPEKDAAHSDRNVGPWQQIWQKKEPNNRILFTGDQQQQQQQDLREEGTTAAAAVLPFQQQQHIRADRCVTATTTAAAALSNQQQSPTAGEINVDMESTQPRLGDALEATHDSESKVYWPRRRFSLLQTLSFRRRRQQQQEEARECTPAQLQQGAAANTSQQPQSLYRAKEEEKQQQELEEKEVKEAEETADSEKDGDDSNHVGRNTLLWEKKLYMLVKKKNNQRGVQYRQGQRKLVYPYKDGHDERKQLLFDKSTLAEDMRDSGGSGDDFPLSFPLRKKQVDPLGSFENVEDAAGDMKPERGGGRRGGGRGAVAAVATAAAAASAEGSNTDFSAGESLHEDVCMSPATATAAAAEKNSIFKKPRAEYTRSFRDRLCRGAELQQQQQHLLLLSLQGGLHLNSSSSTSSSTVKQREKDLFHSRGNSDKNVVNTRRNSDGFFSTHNERYKTNSSRNSNSSRDSDDSFISSSLDSSSSQSCNYFDKCRAGTSCDSNSSNLFISAGGIYRKDRNSRKKVPGSWSLRCRGSSRCSSKAETMSMQQEEQQEQQQERQQLQNQQQQQQQQQRQHLTRYTHDMQKRTPGHEGRCTSTLQEAAADYSRRIPYRTRSVHMLQDRDFAATISSKKYNRTAAAGGGGEDIDAFREEESEEEEVAVAGEVGGSEEDIKGIDVDGGVEEDYMKELEEKCEEEERRGKGVYGKTRIEGEERKKKGKKEKRVFVRGYEAAERNIQKGRLKEEEKYIEEQIDDRDLKEERGGERCGTTKNEEDERLKIEGLEEEEGYDRKRLEEEQAVFNEIYDDFADERDAKWVRENLRVGDKETDAILACPGCFVPVCYQCRRDEQAFSLYRAVSARNVELQQLCCCFEETGEASSTYRDAWRKKKETRGNSKNSILSDSAEEEREAWERLQQQQQQQQHVSFFHEPPEVFSLEGSETSKRQVEEHHDDEEKGKHQQELKDKEKHQKKETVNLSFSEAKKTGQLQQQQVEKKSCGGVSGEDVTKEDEMEGEREGEEGEGKGNGKEEGNYDPKKERSSIVNCDRIEEQQHAEEVDQKLCQQPRQREAEKLQQYYKQRNKEDEEGKRQQQEHEDLSIMKHLRGMISPLGRGRSSSSEEKKIAEPRRKAHALYLKDLFERDIASEKGRTSGKHVDKSTDGRKNRSTRNSTSSNGESDNEISDSSSSSSSNSSSNTSSKKGDSTERKEKCNKGMKGADRIQDSSSRESSKTDAYTSILTREDDMRNSRIMVNSNSHTNKKTCICGSQSNNSRDRGNALCWKKNNFSYDDREAREMLSDPIVAAAIYASLPENQRPQLHAVQCCVCSTTLGIYEKQSGIYHLSRVLPSEA